MRFLQSVTNKESIKACRMKRKWRKKLSEKSRVTSFPLSPCQIPCPFALSMVTRSFETALAMSSKHILIFNIPTACCRSSRLLCARVYPDQICFTLSKYIWMILQISVKRVPQKPAARDQKLMYEQDACASLLLASIYVPLLVFWHHYSYGALKASHIANAPTKK